jgi:hypothetical protein
MAALASSNDSAASAALNAGSAKRADVIKISDGSPDKP